MTFPAQPSADTRQVGFAPDAAAHARVTEELVALRLDQLARLPALCARVAPERAPALPALLERLPRLDAPGRTALARDPFFHASFTRLVTALRAADREAARTALNRLIAALLLPAARLMEDPIHLPLGPGGVLSLGTGGPRVRPGSAAADTEVRFHDSPDGVLHWSTASGDGGPVTAEPSGNVVLDGDDERLPPMLAELAADPDSFSTETVEPVHATDRLERPFREVLERLRATWPAMYEEITTSVSLVVPIRSSRTAAFSNTAWQGAVFLRDDFSDPLFLVERLVHEASHLHLNAVMARTPLHTHAWDDHVESPFRNGPRPVTGLLHGVFVFTRAAEALLRTSAGTPDAERGARQARALVDKVSVAMTTVRSSVRLTEAGRHLIDDTERAHDAVRARCGTARPAAESDYLRGEM